MAKKEKRTDTVRAARSDVVTAARGVLAAQGPQALGEAVVTLADSMIKLDDRLAASATQREAQKALAEN
jgi:hypothetical protein